MANGDDGIEKNKNEAKKHYKLSIDSGNKEATIKCREIITDDIVYPKTEEELSHLKAAADNGHEKALIKNAKYICIERLKTSKIKKKSFIMRNCQLIKHMMQKWLAIMQLLHDYYINNQSNTIYKYI